MRIFAAVVLIVFILSGCKSENSKVREKISEEQKDTASETPMTPEESFSASLVQDILNEDDDDLQIYLEEEFYPEVSKSKKVTIDKVSSSLYILSYDADGKMKNYLLQKFYNPDKDEFIFDKKEVDFNAADKLAR